MEADRRENCFQTQRQDANTMPSSSCQRHVKRVSVNDQHRQGAGEKPHTEIINHLPCLSLLPSPYMSFLPVLFFPAHYSHITLFNDPSLVILLIGSYVFLCHKIHVCSRAMLPAIRGQLWLFVVH